MRFTSPLPGDSTLTSGPLTRSEIFQQPELWPLTLNRVRISRQVARHLGRPVVITGAGTSAYAAAAIASAWPNAVAIPTTDLLTMARDEFEQLGSGFADNGLVISLARSGDSPESLGVVQRLQRMFPAVQHLAITCNEQGQLAHAAGVEAIVLDPRTNDRSLVMTSSFSNLVLAGLALVHAGELIESIDTVAARTQRQLEKLDQLAERLVQNGPAERVVILASRPMSALAAEASLKILESTAGRTVTLAETFLGLRHGPLSFLRPDTLVVCWLSTNHKRRQYERDLLLELKQKGLGRIVAIGAQPEPELFDESIGANSSYENESLRIPFEIPFAQLLAFRLSLAHGLDPDNPSPGGAITRVVQKFRLYSDGEED